MATTDAVVEGPAPTVERPSYLTVGIVVFLSSEVMFFFTLFAAMFTLRAENPEPWKPESAELSVALGVLLTALLVTSSVTQHMAASAAASGNVPLVRRWMGTTLALGLVFIAGQAYEWSVLGFSVASHPFGSAFFTMTGFHGLHVIGGLIALAVVLGRTSQPGYLLNGPATVETVTTYWHFVDVVWIAVFASLYLLT